MRAPSRRWLRSERAQAQLDQAQAQPQLKPDRRSGNGIVPAKLELNQNVSSGQNLLTLVFARRPVGHGILQGDSAQAHRHGQPVEISVDATGKPTRAKSPRLAAPPARFSRSSRRERTRNYVKVVSGPSSHRLTDLADEDKDHNLAPWPLRRAHGSLKN